MSLAVALTDRVARVVESRTTRRGFVNRSAMVGSALALSGSYVLRPGTAYAAICSCPRRSGAATRECNCSDLCCDGYTEFCCQIYGKNSCPADTVLAGWWKVDESSYCDGTARYYMDCNQLNPPCACGPAGACRAADSTCQCRSCSKSFRWLHGVSLWQLQQRHHMRRAHHVPGCYVLQAMGNRPRMHDGGPH